MAVPTPINADTLALLLDLTRGTPAEQLKLAQSLENKTMQVVTAASVLIGLTAATVPPDSDIPWWLILLAVIPYLAVVTSAIYALWIRRFEVVDDPRVLWETLYDVEPDDARHSIMDRLAATYIANEDHLTAKRAALTVALVAMMLEAILIATALMAALS